MALISRYFMVWKRKIMFLLSAENIDYVIDQSEPEKPSNNATAEEKSNYSIEHESWAKDNKRARIFILGSMIDALAAEYEGERIAGNIMSNLKKDFGDVSLIKVLSLVNRFLSTKMNEGASVNEHINKLSVLAEELKNAGYPFQEEVQVMVVLNSLPNSWEQFKISFCHSERSLSMRTLRHHLLLEEDRKLSRERKELK
uniref:Retrovirus-related Pol polyprotein from transposon TNT 1-94 n=1 Tax=Arundo donax TaxID=35708 RepID=A0A0A9DNL4_ARUDO